MWATAAGAAPTSPFTYVHDGASRLVAAVDPDGETARYHYDSVGNLVSIDRVSSAVTRVLEMAPQRGPVGTKVMIYGTGFSATPAQNTVTFNGTQATVTAATKSRLEVTVPLAATSGPIAVTGTGGSASSPQAFTVGAVAPAIGSVSASSADPDAAITIAGQRFDPTPARNNVTINGTFAEVTAASASALQVRVPPAGVASGPVVVETPEGRDVGPDLFIPPTAGLTTASLGATARMAIGAQQVVSQTTAGQHALVVFSGTKGQRVAIRSQTSFSPFGTLALYGPNGKPIGAYPGASITNGGFFDTVTLPDTGSFTVHLSPIVGRTGTLTLSLYDVAPDTRGDIEPSGPPVTVNNTTPGQNHHLTFEGTPGQRVSLEATGLTYGSGLGAYISIRGPDGANIVQPAFASAPGGGYLDVMTLSQQGTHTVVVDPDVWAVGSATLKLHNVPGDLAETTTPGGDPVTVTTTAPGQNAVVSFAAGAGQRVSVKLSGITMAATTVRLRRPDGTTVAGPVNGYGPSGFAFLDAVTLPSAGVHTILVDPSTNSTGSATIKVHQVTDATGPIAPDGSPTAAVNSVPGQNVALSFEGVAGQRVSATIAPSLTGDVSGSGQGTLYLLAPNGSQLGSAAIASSGFLDTKLLPASGTYTAYVDPARDLTGTVTLRLYDVQDATTSATIGGGAASVQTTTPGQNAQVGFSATAGQRVSISSSGLAFSGARVTLKGPAGQMLSGPTTVNQSPYFFEPVALAQTGGHTIDIDPSGAWTGTASLTLHDVPADVSGTIAMGGSAPISITAPGQNATLTFAGTQGQQLNLAASGVSLAGSHISVKRPDGLNLMWPTWVGTAGGSWALSTLPATGTYTILVNPEAANTGAMTVSLANQAGGQALPSGAPQGAASGDPGASAHQSTRPAAPEGPARARRSARRTPAPAAGPPSPRPAARRLALLRPVLGRAQLVGRVRTTRGEPLAGVSVRVGRSRARTDARGVFRLTRLVPGRRALIIDGTTARGRGARYGMFEAAVRIHASRRTDLPHTVWMQRLDLARTITLPRVLRRPFVARTRAIPGLQLRIPKGARIVDRRGRQVRKLTITRIPVRRPPHPLPEGVRVPVYFTIQPALARVVKNGRPAKARLTYPNYTYQRRGTRMLFWNYQGAAGWQVYGAGRVTRNRLVVPDRGVGLTRLSGAMISNGPDLPLAGAVPSGAKDGDPVDLATGLFGYQQSDLALPDVLPIALTRSHNSGEGEIRAFGNNTTVAYDMFLVNDQAWQSAWLVLPDGGRIRYERISPGTSQSSAVYAHTATPGPFYGSRLSYRPGNGETYDQGWDLRLRDGTVLTFGGSRGALVAITDRFGNEISILRETPQSNISVGRIRLIRSPNGRWIKPTYNASDWIVSARDNLGRTVGYAYTSNRLTQVTNPAGGTTQYGWTPGERIQSITDARGITFLTNAYDGSGRVVGQTQADGTTYGFAYSTNPSGAVTATEVTDPRGIVRRLEFSPAGYPLSDTAAHGTAEALTTTYARQAAGNLVTRVTDPLGRHTDLTYNDAGDLTSLTRLAGTAGAVSTQAQYEPTYGLPTQVTDPLGHATSLAYDARGALTSVTDPTGRSVSVNRDEDGQPTRLTDPLGHTTTLAHSAGALQSVSDHLGNTTSAFTDGGGRPLVSTDATGRRSSATFDALNRPSAVRDGAGAETTFAYDPNGNLTSLTDARGGTTSYAYDPMDRPAEREDPLGKTETFAYDANGNLASATDRTGALTRFAYDRHDRRTFAGFAETAGSPPAYESTIAYAYDAGGRLVEADDSEAGAIALSWDGLDRLASEQTPEGTLSYAYDAAGRRTAMDTAGQPQTTYAYDDAGRPTAIARGALAAGFAYDAAGRPSRTTLPGGVAMGYGHDAADRLTRITYANGAGELGRIDYGYDPAGRREEVSGSWARLSLPQPMGAGTYDAANRLTARGASTYVHDDNGNLTSDGSRSFSWNARGQLTAITGGPTPASFAYDALGRRRQASVGGVATTFRYDAENAIVETRGSASVRILSALGPDSALARTDASGTQSFLTDALGSTVALADGAGATVSEYAYEPFGRPSALGAPSDNRIQFTGREWDGTGLQYSRARYYSPELGRFISEDPIGFAGGDTNLYAYVGNAPVQFTDPAGLHPLGGLADAWQDKVAMPAMDFLVDTVHPVAQAAVPGYGLGYALGRRKGAGEIAFAAAAAVPGGRASRIPALAAGAGRRASTRWGQVIGDFRQHPGDWRRISAHAEPAMSKRYRGGLSIEEIFERKDGQLLVRHRIYGRGGEVSHETYRPNAKFGLK